MNGIPRKYNESILEFSQRVEKLVRASVSSSVPESHIVDECKGYFLKFLNEPEISRMLTMARSELDFHTMVVKAISLKETAGENHFRSRENSSASRPIFRPHFIGSRFQNGRDNPVNSHAAIQYDDVVDPVNPNALHTTNFVRPPFRNGNANFQSNGYGNGFRANFNANNRNPNGFRGRNFAGQYAKRDQQNRDNNRNAHTNGLMIKKIEDSTERTPNTQINEAAQNDLLSAAVIKFQFRVQNEMKQCDA
uniref:Uncharacterized protein n=1 Tax=Acrobeloides nanus TaxID=290746 RepID=A0A914DDY5_9BILA